MKFTRKVVLSRTGWKIIRFDALPEVKTAILSPKKNLSSFKLENVYDTESLRERCCEIGNK